MGMQPSRARGRSFIRPAGIRLAGLAAALASGLAAAPAAAQSPSAGPDLQGYTAARFVPYANVSRGTVPFTDSAKLNFLVQAPGGGAGGKFTVTMDTGSTGVVISAADLPGYSAADAANYPQGWEYLSSSKRLWIGHWLPRDLVFVDSVGKPLVTASVPVLAVETEINCPGWDEKANKPACDKPKDTVQNPTGIAYMGVGFGREHDGQPQGTPDKNPLLNITAIDGQPVAKGSIRSGYIVSQGGVHVGLTSANTTNFAFTKLQGRSLNAAGQPASDDPRDWPQTTMAVSVNGAPAQNGPVLIDTGIPQMYLTVSNPQTLPTQQVQNPSVPDATVAALAPGAQVTVFFPDADKRVTQYNFTVGEGSPMEPSVAIVTSAASPAFVNTGRHLLRGKDVLYDADGGWFGFRTTGQ